MKIFGYEITLKRFEKSEKTKRKRTTGYTRKPWTKEQETELLAMHERGLKRKTMASRLNRTETAIYARLKRLKAV